MEYILCLKYNRKYIKCAYFFNIELCLYLQTSYNANFSGGFAYERMNRIGLNHHFCLVCAHNR